jgi:hypothetical protein
MGFLTVLVFGLLVFGCPDESGLAIWRCQETPFDIDPVASAFRRIGFGRTIGRW